MTCKKTVFTNSPNQEIKITNLPSTDEKTNREGIFSFFLLKNNLKPLKLC
jgi:hypothetical protein